MSEEFLFVVAIVGLFMFLSALKLILSSLNDQSDLEIDLPKTRRHSLKLTRNKNPSTMTRIEADDTEQRPENQNQMRSEFCARYAEFVNRIPEMDQDNDSDGFSEPLKQFQYKAQIPEIIVTQHF